MKFIEKENEKTIQKEKIECNLCLKVGTKFWACTICNLFICEECGKRLSDPKLTRSNKDNINELKLHIRIEPFFCDNCNNDLEPGLSFYCTACNYDLCPECFFDPKTKPHGDCQEQPATNE